MRSKKAYLQTKNDKTGKTEIRCVGLETVQREGIEFEFDVNAEMDLDHNLSIMKTRLLDVTETFYPLPGEKFVNQMLVTLRGGKQKEVVATQAVSSYAEPVPASVAGSTSPLAIMPYITGEQATKLYQDAKALGHTDSSLKQILADYDLNSFKTIPATLYDELYRKMTDPQVFDGLD
jgi:hypothetical protein